MRSLALLAAALIPSPALAEKPPTPFAVQETGKAYRSLGDAVRAIGGRDGTVVIAPGSYRDCAIVEGGRITIRAATRGAVILDGGICEDKAALVLRGREHMIDGIVFQNMAVHDRNGAGIRLEQGDLTVTDAFFRRSQEGILTGDDPRGTIRIDRSTFASLGRCDGWAACAHSIYVGHYGRVIVTNTRFERGNGGHYFKSRAAVNEVTGNSFDDAGGHETNYAIDLCAGSTGVIANNVFVQGPNKENHSGIIVVGAEEHSWPSAGLRIENNSATLAPGADGTYFLVDWTHEPLAVGRNTLGPGIDPFDQKTQ